MRPGPPPTPTAIRELQGNPSKRPLPEGEPKLTPLSEYPQPPQHLGDGIARDKWLELARILTDAGVLTSGDLHNLEGFCLAYERWRAAEAEIKITGIIIEGEKGPMKSPANAVIAESMKQWKELGSLLGLDPSSRTRLVVDKPAKKNPFAQLMQ